MNTDLVPVRIGDCGCPDTPHTDGDFVSLRPKLGLAAGTALQNLIVKAHQSSGMDAAALTGILAEAYLLHGVAEWTLLDSNSKPIPVTPETIRYQLLDDFSRSEAAADKADDLYMGPVLAPLVQRALASLPTTPTNGRTSPTRLGAKRPKSSKRSSTTTSPMDSTAPISIAPDGASSS
jgi:hypothetical protein